MEPCVVCVKCVCSCWSESEGEEDKGDLGALDVCPLRSGGRS